MESLHEDLSRLGRLATLLVALLANLVLGVLSSVRVETEQNLSVAQRVLLLNTSALGCGVALGLVEH